MLLWCDELGLQAFAANHEYDELAVRDQPAALGRARRRRPRVPAQERGQGACRPRGAAGDVHGQAVRGPGRLGLPPPRLGRRRGAKRVRRSTRPDGVSDGRRPLHRGRPRACAGPPGAPRADGQRLQARSCPTTSRRTTPTGGSTTARRSSASHSRAARGPGSRSAAGDGSACAHLVVAAILSAGLDGIERELDAAAARHR